MQKWNGTDWEDVGPGTGLPLALGDLSDVDAAGANPDDALVQDDDGVWRPREILVGGPGAAIFNYSGEAVEWTVPAGVEEVAIEMWGGQGGGFQQTPGEGGHVSGVRAVTPGEVLIVRVGGAGTATGGFNGGGLGDVGAQTGGGGASDVRQGGDDLADRIMVAAGGGGAGNADGFGGDGGADVGQAGGNNGNWGQAASGAGGTQIAGGAQSPWGTNLPGGLGVGGAGVSGGPGGGGGYYGGASGGSHNTGDRGGAGGGSNFAPGPDDVSERGGRTGHGRVEFVWS